MTNSSRVLYQAFLKKGLSKEDAFFAVIDHYFGLCGNVDEINRKETQKLDVRVNALEKGSA
ncbi:hypothetical protein [Limnoglobus roseus]|uniref:Uncharacterized protein n=1 Tax=Limnoglobus roseus TaxID=2598579 RepID=A0A5C1AAB6_9BACT|nr:hypothetical protein [Limnoglobus roseus]QEL14762.1 hypothetical protein PX52LOC_01656 [Limnoglobus roseus]